MAKVFISHSAKDREFAARLSADLEGLGHRPWFDEWEIKVGDSIQTEIERGIKEADYVVVVLSTESIKSHWVDKEWKLKHWDEVDNNRIMVLPVLLDDCDIPLFLKEKKWADFRTSYSIGFHQLASALEANRQASPGGDFSTPVANLNFFRPAAEARTYRPHVYNLPRPVEAFVKRPKYFDEIMYTLDLANRALGTAIEGIGGVGKTTIAIEAAEHCRQAGLFERIIWTTAQTQRLIFNRESLSTSCVENFYELEGLLDEIIRAFGRTDKLAYSLEEKQRYARRQLDNISCLLVIDNLESIKRYDMIAAFLAYVPATTKIITTTRKQYRGQGERRLPLPPMSFEEVCELIKGLCERKKIDIPSSQLKKLYDMVGGIPLALVWVVGQFSRAASQVDEFIARLNNLRATGAAHEHESQVLEFCFRESYQSITPQSKQMLNVLGLFPVALSVEDIKEVLSFDVTTLESAYEELVDTFSLVHKERGRGEQEYLTILPWTRYFVRYELAKGHEGIEKDLCARYAQHWASAHPKSICAFTPDYKPIELPEGATPLDFAYHIHTEVGHGFAAARINAQPVPVDQAIQNGDLVEIITNERRARPHEQWLEHVHTNRAERAISRRLDNKQRAVAAVQLANTLALRSEFAEAETIYSRAVNLDPHNDWARHKLGHQLRIKGQTGAAFKLFQKTLAQDDRNPFAFEGLGAVYYQTGNIAEAANCFNKALSIRADYRNALVGLARCFCVHGSYQVADNLLVRALETTIPRRQIAVINLFRMVARLGLGDAEQAMTVYLDKALREFNQIAPYKKLKAPQQCGSHFLYYYSIALACGASKNYSNYLRRAFEVCGFPGLLNEILVDLKCFTDALMQSLQEAVKKELPGGTICNKISDLKVVLRKQLKVSGVV